AASLGERARRRRARLRGAHLEPAAEDRARSVPPRAARDRARLRLHAHARLKSSGFSAPETNQALGRQDASAQVRGAEETSRKLNEEPSRVEEAPSRVEKGS